MTQSFWKDAAASLPPQVRRRHEAEFEAAERYEHLLDLAITGWHQIKRVLARSCKASALGMRAGARSLDAAARLLSTSS